MQALLQKIDTAKHAGGIRVERFGRFEGSKFKLPCSRNTEQRAFLPSMFNETNHHD